MDGMLAAFGSLPAIGGRCIEDALRRTRIIVDMPESTFGNSPFDYRGFAEKHGFGGITEANGVKSTVSLSNWLNALLQEYNSKIRRISGEMGPL
ncbi:MAG: hypothetical protein WC861_06985 [Candidatus Micrarchaeia archaeon]